MFKANLNFVLCFKELNNIFIFRKPYYRERVPLFKDIYFDDLNFEQKLLILQTF